MIEHTFPLAQPAARVVVMGAGGFVGAAATALLEREGVPVVALTRREIDLLGTDADHKLAALLHHNDSFVVISAVAPCKDQRMLVDNIVMMKAVCSAIGKSPPAHVIYISSDAVYADSDQPLTESSCAEPGSLHGAMHITREVMMRGCCTMPLAILRPSLLFGAMDTHNGYGPNQFRRLAAAGKDIVLFGEGEERRDHVFIDDAAEIIRLVIMHRSRGIFNIATGKVFSFREIAEMVASHFSPPPAIKTTPRMGPMPHGGYRPFSISACREAFPEFSYTSLAEGIRKAHIDTVEDSHGRN